MDFWSMMDHFFIYHTDATLMPHRYSQIAHAKHFSKVSVSSRRNARFRVHSITQKYKMYRNKLKKYKKCVTVAAISEGEKWTPLTQRMIWRTYFRKNARKAKCCKNNQFLQVFDRLPGALASIFGSMFGWIFDRWLITFSFTTKMLHWCHTDTHR